MSRKYNTVYYHTAAGIARDMLLFFYLAAFFDLYWVCFISTFRNTLPDFKQKLPGIPFNTITTTDKIILTGGEIIAGGGEAIAIYIGYFFSWMILDNRSNLLDIGSREDLKRRQ